MAKNNNNNRNNNNNNNNSNNSNNNRNNDNNSSSNSNNSNSNNCGNNDIESQLAKIKEFTLSNDKNDKAFSVELHVNNDYFMISAVDKKTNYLYKGLFTLNDLYRIDRYFKLFTSPEEIANDIYDRYENKSMAIIDSDKLSFIFITIKWQLNSKNFETKLKLIGIETNKELQMIQMSNSIEKITKTVSQLQLELNQKDKKLRFLIDYIENKSNILGLFHQYEYVLNHIEETTKKSVRYLNVLYKASVHGKDYETIKSKVYKKSNIVVLFENDNGYCFGGYTSAFFEENNDYNNDYYKSDDTAFIFNANQSIFYPIKNPSHALRLNRNNVFMFGDSDIVIKRDFSRYSSNYYNSYGGSTAQNSYDFVEKEYPFTGKQNYNIKEIEVYQCTFFS